MAILVHKKMLHCFASKFGMQGYFWQHQLVGGSELCLSCVYTSFIGCFQNGYVSSAKIVFMTMYRFRRCICSKIGTQNALRKSYSLDHRAQSDWAYEFPDRTGPDTQICGTVLARQDYIRTYIFKHFHTKHDLLTQSRC